MEDMHIHLKKGVNDYTIMKNYINRCIELKLDKVVFLDHGNRISEKHTPVLNDEKVIQKFLNLIEIAQKEYPNIKIYSGIEVDYSKDLDFQKREIKIMKSGFDYIIGSVHGIKNLTKEEYYKENLELIDSYPINILAHLKLYEDYLNYGEIIDKIIKKCKEKNIKIEINTSERSIWTEEQFNYMIELLKKYKVSYTVGSDSHKVEELGTNYDVIGKRINASICLQ